MNHPLSFHSDMTLFVAVWAFGLGALVRHSAIAPYRLRQTLGYVNLLKILENVSGRIIRDLFPTKFSKSSRIYQEKIESSSDCLIFLDSQL